MNGVIVKTNFLKSIIDKLPMEIKRDLSYDDSLLFDLASFTSVSEFYMVYNVFRRDRYDLKKKFKEGFIPFVGECAIALNQKNDYKRLLFLYAILSTHILEEKLEPYLAAHIENKETIDDLYNMLDYFYAKSEAHDLTKESLYSIYPNGFIYYDYIEDLIHNPLIRNYQFMASKNYFKKSYKRFEHYAKHHTKGKLHKITFAMWNALFARTITNKKYFLYRPDFRLSLLNETHNELVIQGLKYTSSIEDIYQQATEEALKYIHALNSYLFEKQTKDFKVLFQISENKKI